MAKTKSTDSSRAVPIYGPEGPITPFQKKRIMHNCNYQAEIKNEWVQWVTGDTNRTSLSGITQAQAVRIIKKQTGIPLTPEGGTTADQCSPPLEGLGEANWGAFDKNNSQHRYILSILRQANIVVKSEKWGEIPDMSGFFNRFLRSPKSPVKKPLKQMSPTEVSKIITALEGVALWKNQI
jgi:hypothetical protein